MVAQDFINAVKSFEIGTYVGVEDFADKFNFQFTTGILLICTAIVTVRQYLLSPISCMLAAKGVGNSVNEMDYVNNYCWVEGTAALPLEHGLDKKSMKEQTMNYYQWVPFVLGLQCIMFYAPRLIWQVITYNSTGTDMEHLVKVANEAVHESDEKKHKNLVKHVVDTIDFMLEEHRDLRRGCIASLKRKVFEFCAFILFSKRLGTRLMLSYLVIKALYLTNAIGQLYMMEEFLQLKDNIQFFGLSILQDIRQGRTWNQTMVFPRVTLCRYDIRLLGHVNAHIAQCSLPINMINEKIYIFLWFWILVCAVITGISIPVWVVRMASITYKRGFIRKFLMSSPKTRKVCKDNKAMNAFVLNYLRHDGFFILKMIALNVGDVIAAEIVRSLFEKYSEAKKETQNSAAETQKESQPKKETQNSNVYHNDAMTGLPPHPTKNNYHSLINRGVEPECSAPHSQTNQQEKLFDHQQEDLIEQMWSPTHSQTNQPKELFDHQQGELIEQMWSVPHSKTNQQEDAV